MGCNSSKLRSSHGATFKRRYTPASTVVSSAAMRAAHREGDCRFFTMARGKLTRDYILVIDRSGSMSGSNWKEAREAVDFFAGYICDFDTDGITLILFDDKVKKWEHVSDPIRIQSCFESNPPQGSTDLAAALEVAFMDHFSGTTGASTILVITDGAPDDQGAVAKVIQKAARSITSDEELSISFIQVGKDPGARQFLKTLDDDLDATFDIVDVIIPSDLKEMSFADVIRKSLSD